MGERKKKANQRRQEEKEEVVISNWSDLCPDLLRCVFKRLSFTNLIQAKSACPSWRTGLSGCVPKQNQIPWLILFPNNNNNNNNINSSSSCVLFIPEDRDNVYKTRDLGVDFVKSRCLATYGSWLLMLGNILGNLYILNVLTCERIDLPADNILKYYLNSIKASFWIDNKTKDYLVVWSSPGFTVFNKKSDDDNKWHALPLEWYEEVVYNHKNQKLYAYYQDDPIKIWDFSGDIPHKDGSFGYFRFNYYMKAIAVTLSGDVLNVICFKMASGSQTWDFRIYKANQVSRNWVEIYSLGDEALILDMGVTVLAKNISGIKRNSIYFSGTGDGRKNPNNIFVYDLTTQKIQHLPQCVFSSIPFSDARWFFPEF